MLGILAFHLDIGHGFERPRIDEHDAVAFFDSDHDQPTVRGYAHAFGRFADSDLTDYGSGGDVHDLERTCGRVAHIKLLSVAAGGDSARFAACRDLAGHCVGARIDNRNGARALVRNVGESGRAAVTVRSRCAGREDQRGGRNQPLPRKSPAEAGRVRSWMHSARRKLMNDSADSAAVRLTQLAHGGG